MCTCGSLNLVQFFESLNALRAEGESLRETATPSRQISHFASFSALMGVKRTRCSAAKRPVKHRDASSR